MRIRQSDSIARLGRDEFAVLMPTTEESDCAALRQHLCETIVTRMVDAGIKITTSIGHATFEEVPMSLAETLMDADRAMYAAKSSGEGCVMSFSRSPLQRENPNASEILSDGREQAPQSVHLLGR